MHIVTYEVKPRYLDNADNRVTVNRCNPCGGVQCVHGVWEASSETCLSRPQRFMVCVLYCRTGSNSPDALSEGFVNYQKGAPATSQAASHAPTVSHQTIQESMRLMLLVRAYQVRLGKNRVCCCMRVYALVRLFPPSART